jgi:hypothetical protein
MWNKLLHRNSDMLEAGESYRALDYQFIPILDEWFVLVVLI